jgi:hypothetical protein
MQRTAQMSNAMRRVIIPDEERCLANKKRAGIKTILGRLRHEEREFYGSHSQSPWLLA